MDSTELKTLKCTECRSYRYCRKRNITKGSMTCDIERGLAQPKKKKEPDNRSKANALLGYLLSKKEDE